MEAQQAAHRSGDYARLRELVVAACELLPRVVDAFNSEYAGRDTTVPPSIPALDDLARLAAVYRDRSLLDLLRSTVGSRPDLVAHAGLVERSENHLALTGRVLGLVGDEPGIVQSALGKRLGVHGKETRSVVLWLDKTGQVHVVDDGKAKHLYLPGRMPAPRPPVEPELTPDTRPTATIDVDRRPLQRPAPVPPSHEAIEGCRAGTFAAIDFETATAERASACALAVTIVDAGVVTASESWLIRPPGNRFDAFNTYLHGIGPANTSEAPGFLAVMAEALAVIGDRPVIAHYAAFDLAVLRHSYLAAGVPWPTMQLGCTVVLGRRTWPGLPSYSLPVIANWLGLAKFTHHDAAADSRACADVARAAIATTSADSLDASAREVGVAFGRLEAGHYEPCRALWKGIPERLVPPDPASLDPDHPLNGANVSFTGTLWSLTRADAAQIVLDAGGRFNPNPGRKTDYLVFGQQDFTRFVDGQASAKTKKALALIDDGYPLQIVEEAAFIRMI